MTVSKRACVSFLAGFSLLLAGCAIGTSAGPITTTSQVTTASAKATATTSAKATDPMATDIQIVTLHVADLKEKLELT
jgi:hypothetical protein